MKTEPTEVAPIEKKEKGTGMNAYPVGRWTLKANPFKSAAKPVRTPVVQGELSLEKVKVVRNDLSDSDLELVMASRGKTATPFASAEAAPASKLSVWGRIKARLFRPKGK